MALTQISTAGVKDDAVTAGKIPANAVGSSELADNAVDTAAIAADAVTSAKIADNAVVSAAINADAVTGAKIADDAINSEHYTDGSIDTAHIADDQITTAKIAAGNITATELGTGAVTSAKLAAGAVSEAAKIADSIITGAKIGSGTIAAGNLATDSVTTGKIANDAVTVDKVADDAIGVAQLSASGTASSTTFLRGDNSWTTVSTDLLNDTSPQLGGDLDTNSHNISLDDDHKVNFGDSNDFSIQHTSGGNYLEGDSTGSTIFIRPKLNEESIKAIPNGAVELYHDASKKLNTHSSGILVSGGLNFGASSGSDPIIDNTDGGNGNALFVRTGGSSRIKLQSDGILNLWGRDASFSTQTTRHMIANDNSSDWIADIVNTAGGSYGVRVRVNSNSASREGFDLYSDDDTQSKASIMMNGTYLSRSDDYAGYSDVKLKDNIVDAKSQWDDVKAVRVRNFNWKDKPKEKLLGVVAQELESICPNLIHDLPDKETDKDTGELKETGTVTKAAKYSILHMKAFKALQEAMARIETLETKVAALEAA